MSVTVTVRLTAADPRPDAPRPAVGTKERRMIPTLFLLGLLGPAAQAAPFTLTSPDVPAGSTIKPAFVFDGFGCTGRNVSPALRWSGAPEGTKSFALIVHDPDAVTGVGGFTHWIIHDIPARATGLASGAGRPDASTAPTGAVQPSSSFGTPGWSGPCPPVGEKAHRYVFTLYALRVDRLELPANAGPALVGFTINGHALAKTGFTAVYGR